MGSMVHQRSLIHSKQTLPLITLFIHIQISEDPTQKKQLFPETMQALTVILMQIRKVIPRHPANHHTFGVHGENNCPQ